MSDDQLSMLDGLKPHAYLARNARDTSREAAKSVLPRSGTQRRRVFDFIASHGESGATDEEIFEGAGIMVRSSVTPRRLELVEAGLVRDSGKRRPTPSGLNAIVWVVSETNA